MSYESMSDAQKTIARVWEALGSSAYSECGGLEISQIVAKRVAELKEARAELAQKDAEIEAYKIALDITRSEKTREWCIACGYKTERDAYKTKLEQILEIFQNSPNDGVAVVLATSVLKANQPAPATEDR